MNSQILTKVQHHLSEEYPHEENNLKLSTHLKVKAKPINFLEEKIGRNLKQWSQNQHKNTTAKEQKLDLIKIKNGSAASNFIKKLKRQPTEWEKIPVNHLSDQGLVSRRLKRVISPLVLDSP